MIIATVLDNSDLEHCHHQESSLGQTRSLPSWSCHSSGKGKQETNKTISDNPKYHYDNIKQGSGLAEAGGGGEMHSPFSPELSPSILSPSQVPALPWSFLLCLRPRYGFFPLNDHRSFYLNYHFCHTLLFMIGVYASGLYRVELQRKEPLTWSGET